MREVLKRDGRTVLFDEAKISQAVLKAMKATNLEEEGLPALVTKKVNERIDVLYKDKLCSVEDIQDEVESVLIELGKDKLSKNYILYRNERNRIRDSKSLLMKQISDITLKDKDEVDEKRENANIDGDTAMGVMLKMGSETAKSFYLQSVIDKRFSSAHKEGLIHIHDLDFYTLTMTCCQIDLIKLFEGGFSTGHGHLREPKDIRSYASLAAIAIQANQNDQHGGQSVPNFDYAMAKGVKKTYKKTLIKNLYHALSLDKNTQKSSVESFLNGLEDKGIEVGLSSNEYVLELFKKYEKNLGVDAKLKIERIVTITKEETEEQTLQAMEALVHNLNTMHSRAGAQVPFSSLNYGTDTSV
ncbi:MAG: anaerobic ribonucleoside-triphosphate reductase, partial [Paracholeplasma sp.]